MASWNLLDEKEELELHKSRLLNVEEKPFKRITKRLAAVSALAGPITKQQPTPPPEGANGEHEVDSTPKRDLSALRRERDQLKDDLTLDFAAFDSSIARLQFLLDANARERERYKADQQRILEEGNAVRTNNVQLREQLEEAKATLAQRKKFDELAEKITSNRLLRPREDQIANLAKLEEECRELERESETYSETWRERRDQFNKIMDEGMQLRRQIRDEKEEVERREGMNEADEEDGEASRGGQTPRHIPSGNVTPHPESGTTSRMDGASGARTPVRDSQGDEKMDGLKPKPDGQGSLSRGGSLAPSRDATPNPHTDDGEIEEGEDVDMIEVGGQDTATETQATSAADTPQITVDAPEGNADKMELDTQ